MLVALTLMWGSSFLFTKLAVEALAFEQIVSARLALAALILVPTALALHRPVPREPRAWLFFLLMAVIGNLVPFSLITWGQRSIESGLAGILMAVMPLATLGLAHLFVPGERLTRARVGGFVLGLAGVILVLGPDALLAIGGERGPLVPMLAVLAGALCYGVSAILSRLRPTRDALTTAASVTSLATLLSLPAAAASTSGVSLIVSLTPAVIGAVIFLGLFSTATAMIVYFRLIQTAGVGFTSQLNYLIPLWAVAIGILFLDEALSLDHLGGLALILVGILVARRGARPTPTSTPDAEVPAPGARGRSGAAHSNRS